MISPALSRPLSILLAAVIASPYLAAQNAPAPVPAAQATPAPPNQAPPNQAPPNQAPPNQPAPLNQVPGLPTTPSALPQRLSLTVLEGDKVINSIPSAQSTAVIVEVRNENEFPVEGAEVVFTLPADGSAGTFARGGLTYTTRTDVSGQAAAPPLVPKQAGKFQITVAATLGNRKGEVSVTQTNSAKANVAEVQTTTGGKPFYKKKLFWIATGAAVGGIVAAIVLTSSSSQVTVTPGTPVFH